MHAVMSMPIHPCTSLSSATRMLIHFSACFGCGANKVQTLPHRAKTLVQPVLQEHPSTDPQVPAATHWMQRAESAGCPIDRYESTLMRVPSCRPWSSHGPRKPNYSSGNRSGSRSEPMRPDPPQSPLQHRCLLPCFMARSLLRRIQWQAPHRPPLAASRFRLTTSHACCAFLAWHLCVCLGRWGSLLSNPSQQSRRKGVWETGRPSTPDSRLIPMI